MSEDTQLPLNLEDTISAQTETNTPVVCLGITFNNDDERRVYFREELRKKLPELKRIEGFPIGEDDDIINLSDPPYYTACPNPWLNDFISQWEMEKEELERQGKRSKDFEVTEPYASDVSEGKNNPIYNAHTYHTKVPHPAIMRYILHYTQPGDIILDSFAGTGMTGVAASICGKPDKETKLNIENEFSITGLDKPIWDKRNAICSDLSPYASFIASNYNIQSDTKHFIQEFEKIIKDLKDKYNFLYKTDDGNISYVAWSRVFACEICGHLTDYFTSCYKFIDGNWERNNSFKCEKCNSLNTTNKTIKEFKTIFDKTLQETRLVANIIPVLINYKKAKGRFYKELNNEDWSKINYCINNIDAKSIPIKKLDQGFNLTQPQKSHGYSYVHDFYPVRTLFLLSEFYKLIEKSKFKNNLLFVFTSILPKLTYLNRYMPEHGGRALVGPRVGTLYVPHLSIENNVFEQLDYQYKKVVQAFELIKNKNVISVISATNLNLQNESVDYVFLDPPFGANIMYSELNNLPECWLKLFTDNNKEAIENSFQNKSLFVYKNLMIESFKELYRIIKPNKWMTVEFSNTSAAVWNAIQNSIQSAGFVIAGVTDLDKKRPGLVGMIGNVAVKQDLAITCYKPSSKFDTRFQQSKYKEVGIWDFVTEHLNHLTPHLVKDNNTTAILERNPKILYDRLIAFYVQRNLPVPIDAALFQKGLRERFVERDGMFFTAEQALQYEEKRRQTTGVVQMSVFVSSEAEGIEWLKRKLDTPQTYQDLQPQWMQDLSTPRKGDNIPELKVILEDNFLHDEDGRWYKPDLEKETDLEKVRTRKLLKEFNYYVELAAKPKVKIKEARLEALRCGFRECYRNNDFQTIVSVGNRLPEALIMEDEILLQFYDIALAKV